jgi:hypothetical protein
MKKEDEYKMIEQQIEKKKRIKKYINVVHGVKSNLHGLNFGNIMIIVRGKIL